MQFALSTVGGEKCWIGNIDYLKKKIGHKISGTSDKNCRKVNQKFRTFQEKWNQA